MKKNTTAKKIAKQAQGKRRKKQNVRRVGKGKLTIGIDLGDKTSRYCILDEAGEIVSEDQVATTNEGLHSIFGNMAASRIAIEVGTHSPWVSRRLKSMGHEVIVANSHKVRLITESGRKNDRIDAQQLARLARVDAKLLWPIQHRGEQAQKDLAVIRARAELLTARTQLINSARGLVKPLGERLKQCDADQVDSGLGSSISESAQAVIGPLLRSVEEISEQISKYDEQIEEITKRYPEAMMLRQVYGVGQLIALTFILTLEEAGRFAHSRDVGPYLGLTPRQHESGESQPELGISKAGDGLLRSLLVQGAHCLLRKGAPDSDLRKWGLEKMGKGGKRAKKRAIVAVARKLAVLLHHLWATGEVYDPQYNRKAAAAKGKTQGNVAA